MSRERPHLPLVVRDHSPDDPIPTRCGAKNKMSGAGKSWFSGGRLGGLVERFESVLKGRLFNCQMCGQCLLRRTRLICPMNCPKGMRNGPCGGTLDGRCEVEPEKPCTWMRIREPAGRRERVEPRAIHAPIDESLLGTSSFVSFLNGSDRATRRPLPFLELDPEPKRGRPATASELERALLAGRVALTTEVRSPRRPEHFEKVAGEIATLAPLVDALNTTSNHGGVESVCSLEVAREVRRHGRAAIPHVCGRDVTAATYLERLVITAEADVHDILCLTGDWSAKRGEGAEDPHARFFRMEAAQMIYEARFLREKGTSAFADLGGREAPRLFIGAAINPASTPRAVVLERLAQKIDGGADFVQTQAVCDASEFCQWLDAAAERGLRERVFILASVPVLGGARGLEVLRGLPGVRVTDALIARMTAAADAAAEGRAIAQETVEEILAHGGVDGLHFLNFGVKAPQMAELIRHARALAGEVDRTASTESTQNHTREGR